MTYSPMVSLLTKIFPMLNIQAVNLFKGVICPNCKEEINMEGCEDDYGSFEGIALRQDARIGCVEFNELLNTRFRIYDNGEKEDIPFPKWLEQWKAKKD